MDDGTISAPLTSLQEVVSILETDGPQSGLILNKSKCFVWCSNTDPPNSDPLACGIPRSDPRGLHLLGSPIGSPDFMKSVIDQRINNIEEIVLRQLPSLEDPQIQFCLLRSCLSLPKLIYSLRTCNPTEIEPCYSRFDVMQRAAIEEILGASLTD
jgi:hypothetical protein